MRSDYIKKLCKCLATLVFFIACTWANAQTNRVNGFSDNLSLNVTENLDISTGMDLIFDTVAEKGQSLCYYVKVYSKNKDIYIIVAEASVKFYYKYYESMLGTVKTHGNNVRYFFILEPSSDYDKDLIDKLFRPIGEHLDLKSIHCEEESFKSSLPKKEYMAVDGDDICIGLWRDNELYILKQILSGVNYTKNMNISLMPSGRVNQSQDNKQ